MSHFFAWLLQLGLYLSIIDTLLAKEAKKVTVSHGEDKRQALELHGVRVQPFMCESVQLLQQYHCQTVHIEVKYFRTLCF